MVRLKSSEDLREAKGGLVRAFRVSTLAALQNAFLSATSPAEKPKAFDALNQFHRAAQRLRLSEARHRQRISENAFNRKARRISPRSTLLAHLRTPEQFAALRSFNTAKEALLDISPDIGRSIVRLVALGAELTTPQHRPQSIRAHSLK